MALSEYERQVLRELEIELRPQRRVRLRAALYRRRWVVAVTLVALTGWLLLFLLAPPVAAAACAVPSAFALGLAWGTGWPRRS